MVSEINGKCPECGHDFKFATNIDDMDLKPRVGDISFCIRCGSFSEFGESGIVPIDESKLDDQMKKEISRIKSAWVRTKENTFGAG